MTAREAPIPLRSVDLRSAESSSVVSEAEVRALLARLAQPEEREDLGYGLLGPDGNDIAAWTKAVVLANSDYGRLVHSLASQQRGIAAETLVEFDRQLASKGATATYDAVVDSQWIEDASAGSRAKTLVTLIPASTYLGLLFDRQGRLAGSYNLESVATSGTAVAAVFGEPGAPKVTLELEVDRASGGALRVVGVDNYRQVKQALKGTDLAEGLP